MGGVRAVRTREARLVGAGVAVTAVTYGLARYAYGLYLPEFRAEFGLSASAAGALASASYAAFCVAVAASAVLTARWSDRATAILAAATAVVGTALVAAAGSATALGIGVVVAGASTGLATPPLVALVNRGVEPVRRSAAQATVNAGTGVGVLVSGPSALLASGNWRVAWALFAVLGLLVTCAIAAFSCDLPARPSAVADRGRLPAGIARLVLASIGLGAASAAFLTFGRDLVTTTGGLGPGMSALFWVVLGAAGIVAAGTGDIVARIGLARAWLLLAVALAGSTVVVAVAPGSVAVVLASAAVFGASYVALTAVLVLWSARLTPDRTASAVAVSFLALSAGQVVGAGAVGWLIDGLGWLPAFAIAAVAVILAPRPAY